jgi:prepilin-type N-terminal cleavage/methylation domain-containing protein
MMKVRKGFTLIELIVSLAIFLVIIVITFGTLSSYFAVRTANEQEMIIQQNFRVALNRITDDFRQASSNPDIESPGDNTVSKKLIFTGTDGSTKVTYELVNEGNGVYVIKRNSEPVTEGLHQLVDLYFIRSGGGIIVIIVGEVSYFGRKTPITFASLVFSRNANYVKSSP